MDEHSIPAIEGLIRDAIQSDTAISLDSVLLDVNPATVIRPAGILNGVAGLTPTAGGGFNALTGDIKQITGQLLAGTKGNVRNPVWLMNPQQVNSAGLVAAPGAGVVPFRDEIREGRLGRLADHQFRHCPARDRDRDRRRRLRRRRWRGTTV